MFGDGKRWGDVQQAQAQTRSNDDLLALVHLQFPEKHPGKQGKEEVGNDTQNCGLTLAMEH